MSKILVVDDADDVRSLLARLLRLGGWGQMVGGRPGTHGRNARREQARRGRGGRWIGGCRAFGGLRVSACRDDDGPGKDGKKANHQGGVPAFCR